MEVKVVIDGKEYQGMTNIGRKPTISEKEAVGAETYIYDFDENVYGKALEVRLKEFLRPEMKFDNLDQLKAQIESDLKRAR